MENENLHQHFRRGVKWTLLSAVASSVLQVVQMVVFARYAGPEALGVFAVAGAIIAFLAPLTEAGLSQAIVQAKVVSLEQVAALGWVNFMVAVFSCFALYGLAPYFGQWMDMDVLPPVLQLMGFTLLLTPFAVQYGGLLVRHLHFGVGAAIELVCSVFAFVVTILLCWKGAGIWAIVWGYTVRMLLASLGAWWMGRRYYQIPWRSPGPIRPVLSLLRLGLWDMLARYAETAVNYTDKIVAGLMLDPVALGYYNLAFSLYMLPVSKIGQVVARVAFPVLSRMQDNRQELQQFFDRTSQKLVLALVPLYFGMLLFAKEIVQLLYGPQWLPAVPVIALFGLAGIARTMASLLPQVVRGIGRPDFNLYYQLLWLLLLNISILTATALFPDAAGAAVGRVVAEWLFQIPLLFLLASRIELSLKPSVIYSIHIVGWFALAGLGGYYCSSFVSPLFFKILIKTLCLLPLLFLFWPSKKM